MPQWLGSPGSPGSLFLKNSRGTESWQPVPSLEALRALSAWATWIFCRTIFFFLQKEMESGKADKYGGGRGSEQNCCIYM